MYVKRVKLVNAGPFANFETELCHGSVGVFGKNGSGKTTLIRLMHAALTRRFNMFPGVKADLAYSRAAAREPAYVELDASHQGVDFEVTLSLRDRKAGPGKSRLKVSGEAELNAEPEIVERLSQFGLTPPVVDFSVFVYGVYDFIDLTPSKRADVYRTLCGTERASIVHKHLVTVLASEDDLAVEFVDTSDQVAQSLAERQEACHELCVKLEQLLEKRGDKDRLERAARYVKRAEVYKRLAGEHARLTEQQARLKDRVRQALDRKAERQAALDELEAETGRVKKRATRASELLAVLATSRQKQARRERLLERREALLEAGVPPEKPMVSGTIDELAGKVGAIKAKRAELASSLEHLEGVTDNRCPTCRQKIDNPAEYRRHVKAERLSLKGDLERLSAELKAAQRYAQDLAGYKAGESTRAERLAGIDDELASLGPADPGSDVDEDALRKQVRAYEKAQHRVRDAARYLADAEAAVAKLTGQLEVTDRSLARIARSRAFSASAPDPGRVALAEKVLERGRKVDLKVATLKGRLTEAEGEVARLNGELRKIRRKAEVTRRAKRLKDLYNRAVDMTHWDGLPKRVASRTLGRMTGLINDNLALFGRPFSVAATDDMSFQAAIGDAPPRDMAWLSSGQRVLLAVSFWSAASLFAASPGMLVLDEPTANLDAANVDYLGAALATLSGNVRGNRQVLMTSHADGLRGSFDQVVDLG